RADHRSAAESGGMIASHRGLLSWAPSRCRSGVRDMRWTMSGWRGSRAAAAGAAINVPRHVFVIILENEPFQVTFGEHSPAPYLAHELPKQGVLLTRYFATGHYSLHNYISIISGQAPNPETQQDCHIFSEFKRSATGFDANGQIRGSGCVYPADVKTLANQLQDAGYTWKGY